MLAAVIICDQSESAEPSRVCPHRTPWAAAEVLGQAPIARVAENLKCACDSVAVVVNGPSHASALMSETVTVDHAARSLANYRRQGFNSVLVVRCGAYVEVDVGEMFSFHQHQGCEVTRAFADEEPLDVWLADTSAMKDQTPLLSALLSTRAAMYRSREYANPLESPHDYRRLVLDGFQGRCSFRPQGAEIKPGIWVCEGAKIEHSARVVPPAFIGRNVQISDECLITRGSNIESNSRVDFGTVVEDSSILSNTYVGIGLDLSHSIADGCNLLNLQHTVHLEITDPVVMRENVLTGRAYRIGPSIESDRIALSSAE